MAEYIERYSTIEDVLCTSIVTDDSFFGLGFQAGVDAAVRKIANRPAADVVEVVRCKDCQYYNQDLMSPGTGWCEYLERGEWDRHFCSYADRRANE